MQILMGTVELAEAAAQGGLGEFVLGLGTSLLDHHDVRVFLPDYPFLKDCAGIVNRRVLVDRLPVRLGVGFAEYCQVTEAQLRIPFHAGRTLPLYLAAPHRHFRTAPSAQHIYKTADFTPWLAFSRCLVDFLEHTQSSWAPEVLHTQDAHTAGVPVFVSELRRRSEGTHWSHKVRLVHTVHNPLEKGQGPKDLLRYAGLPDSRFHIDDLEYHGDACFLKSGMLSADVTTTVSPTYARELQTSSRFGFGLEGVFAQLARQGRLVGILNGIDDKRWAPAQFDREATDAASILRMKTAQRAKLFHQMGRKDDPQFPLFGLRARFDTQKGLVLLAEALPGLLQLGKLLLVTWGGPGQTETLRKAWGVLEDAAKQFPDRLYLNPQGLSGPETSAMSYAACDATLMPSTYEPAGLVQQEAQRYGCLIVACRTGGLADTVFETATPGIPSPNGFLFDHPTVEEFHRAVERCTRVLRDPVERLAWVDRALRQENSWESRRPAYEEKVYGR